MKEATIFNIQRFSTHDGPGTRTTVFFKGCPLNCLWCANPESQKFTPELEIIPKNCIGCGECLKQCPNNALYFDETGINVHRELCSACGKCAAECYSKTLKFVGETKTVDEVVTEILKDEVFYRHSGGGVTFSGGEPLSLGGFVLDVIKECKKYNDINTCIETCAYGDTETFIQLAKELDLMFIDIKHMDPEEHKKYTGVSNELILHNIRSIQPYAKNIILRTPMIAGINDTEENIKATAEFAAELEAVSSWEILPFHNLGEHKYEAIGKDYDKSMFRKPDKEKLLHAVELADRYLTPVGKKCIIESSGL